MQEETELLPHQGLISHIAAGDNALPYSVSELNRAVKISLESEYGTVRVRGEVSKFSIPKSGHLYITLKDADSSLDCVAWKGVRARFAVEPHEGMEVVCTGRLTTYPGRSSYQLVIDSLTLSGEGALLKMLEDRRKKLAAEGLFDASRKKAIPLFPQLIGVITSPSGAVIRDILHRLADRFPRPVLIWPVTVQGEKAAKEIIAAIEGFNRLPVEPLADLMRPDLLIIARGGGSLEDLMPFNDEQLVRAVAASHIPIISAVGHETDTTLIDFAADKRAPTPTAAAEFAVPVKEELMASIKRLDARLTMMISQYMENRHLKMQLVRQSFTTPEQRFYRHEQRLDQLQAKIADLIQRRTITAMQQLSRLQQLLLKPEERMHLAAQKLVHSAHKLQQANQQHIQKLSQRFTQANTRLSPNLLAPLYQSGQQRLVHDSRWLNHCIRQIFMKKKDALQHRQQLLESYSYQQVLNRGFALVRDAQGQVLSPDSIVDGMLIGLEMKNDQRFQAQIMGNAGAVSVRPKAIKRDSGKTKSRQTGAGQKTLFD
ncbi:MAG: exodeoxyribonuclease VII large subunit [Alphaproteobacteria bacterium]